LPGPAKYLSDQVSKYFTGRHIRPTGSVGGVLLEVLFRRGAGGVFEIKKAEGILRAERGRRKGEE
jgi:hypothetical protein